MAEEQEQSQSEVFKMAALQITAEQICEYMDLDMDDFKDLHEKDYQKGRVHGILQLRRWQWSLAQSGDKEMQKALSQQLSNI